MAAKSAKSLDYFQSDGDEPISWRIRDVQDLSSFPEITGFVICLLAYTYECSYTIQYAKWNPPNQKDNDVIYILKKTLWTH